ncbi:MAG TPA: DUF2461 domain-containing protein [Ignavibacteria bacterium]|nr:DUF2461 domain-containing protein [Ignavibacteria bacterium]
MLDELIKPPFLGFSPEAIKFFKALSNKRNNNKKWFDKHREEYEVYIKQPMKDLIDALAVEIKKIDKDIVVNYKSIFRINRDIRFTKDKTPYKNYASAAFAFNKVKSSEIPQFYFHFTPDEFLVAGGQYSTDLNNLKKIRSYIFKNYKQYLKVIDNKEIKKEYGEVLGIKAVKTPRGYENITDKRLQEILKMTQFYIEKQYEVDVIYDASIVELIVHHLKLMRDFIKFLDDAIK